MAETVRSMVGAIHKEVLKGDLQPERARELLLRASALTGNVLQEITDADAAYAVVLLAHLDSEKRANRAKIRAEITDEYRRTREAQNTFKVLEAMERSLKYWLRSVESEIQMSGQQR